LTLANALIERVDAARKLPRLVECLIHRVSLRRASQC
jgi:hypothetical protein